MLVLSRTAGQSLQIGDKITVKVISITERHVRLGIEAPKEIAVIRQEAKDTGPRHLSK